MKSLVTKRIANRKGVFPSISATALLLLTFNAKAEILGDENVTGTVGLNGETFANGTLEVSRDDGVFYNVQFDSSGAFAVSVDTGAAFKLVARMAYFQDTNGSSLTHTIDNLGPLAENETWTRDLRLDSGRISGSVTITGGTLARLDMYTSSSFGDESFGGRAVGDAASAYIALQPMPALAGTTATGWAQVNVSNTTGTCTVSVTLPEETVNVPLNDVVDVSWNVDTSSTDCSKGNLEGNVQWHDAPYVTWQRLGVRGPSYRFTTTFGSDGSYAINNLRTGSYGTDLRATFAHPYGETGIPFTRNAFEITGGNTTIHNIDHFVGTLHGVLHLDGAWDFNDLDYAETRWSGNGSADDEFVTAGSPWYGKPTGQFDLVGLAGTWRNGSLDFQVNDYSRKGANDPWTFANISVGLSQISKDASATVITAGASASASDQSIPTSETLIAFELADALKNDGATITSIQYSGSATVDPSSPYSYVSLFGNIREFPAPGDSHILRILGLPGTYQMNATAYHTGTGGSASSSFQMVLSEPVSIPTGDPAPQDFTDPSGTTIGTLDFENVTEAGATTFSELTIGPDPEEGFKIFAPGGGDPQYFDISTSASFTGQVQVCVDYDDTGLTAGDELALAMAHYVCDANDQCQWEVITQEGHPETVNNTICGLTDSFSIFAIVESPDSDGDGVFNTDDNCPLTPNANQEDDDSDGIGNVCEADTDGDGIIDDFDLCPNLADAENGDIDGDLLGDPCDSDKDGDGNENEFDNCPTISNEGQVDFDEDGLGDACDLDDDGDGVADADDLCPGTAYGEAVPLDGDDTGCTSGQLFAKNCPVDGEYRNHGVYVHCVVDEADRQVDSGMLLSNERGPIVSAAAHSDIGKKANE